MDNNHLKIDIFNCISEFKNCPYRLLNKGVSLCNFLSLFFRSISFERNKRIKSILKMVCPELRSNIMHHDYLASSIQNQVKQFLDNVSIGDIVYCTIEMDNVIFLEKPKNKFDWCQYKSFDGQIKEARAHCFRKISLGNKCAEYKTTEIDDLNTSEILAREYGFRVEKDTLKNSYLLRIYGDEQEDVDHFVICLENNYFVY